MGENPENEVEIDLALFILVPRVFWLFVQQAPVVQKVDSSIHRINHYPVDSAIGLPNNYPLDRDLSGG